MTILPSTEDIQSSDRRAPWWLVVTVLVLAQTLVWLDNTILNIAVETLADPVRGLGATPSELQWAISSYTLVFAASMFAGGALGDRFGPRFILVAGLVVFCTASTFAAFSGDPTELIVARGAMGLGSALVTPATLSLITRASSPENRTRGIAIWVSSTGVAVAIGPVAGGALLSNFWWGSMFLVNVPTVVLCLVSVVAFVPEFHYPEQRRLDPAGLVLSFAGLFGVTYGVIRGGQVNSWLQPDVLWPIAGGLAVLVVFVVVQLNVRAPSFDVRLFRQRQFAGGSLGLVLTFFGLGGQLFYAAFYLQGVREFSPLEAGLLMTPAAVGIIIGNQLCPALVRRFSTRSIVATGMLATVASFASYLLFGTHTAISWFEVTLLVQGLGIGMVSPPTTTAMMAALPRERSGAGSAVNSVLRPVGSTLGVAVLGSILAASYRNTIGPALAELPEAARHQAQSSAEATRFVARSLSRLDLLDAANDAYLRAMYVTAVWTSLLSLIGVVLIVVCFREARTS